MIVLSQVKNKRKSSCHTGKSRFVPSKTESGIIEFEHGLTEYSGSFYKSCSPCAQKCIRPFMGGEKAGPAIKILQFGKKTSALKGCTMELWEAMVLYFSMRERRAECY